MLEVYTRSYPAPFFDVSEAMRYASCGNSEEMREAVCELYGKAEGSLTYKVCYTEVPVRPVDGAVDLGFAVFGSADLAKNLRGCTRAVVFAATVGLAFDRLCAAYGRTSPSRAVLLQGIGAERIESLCDVFTEDVLAGESIRPRFSPGYGDFSIEHQKDIFTILDPPRRIGLTLTDSILMSPTKSVTALIGIK